MKVKFLISSIPFHLWKTSASQLWLCLITVQMDEPFSHLNSHDERWKLMMVEGALLWLTFFNSCHSPNHIEVVEEGFHEVSSFIKCYWGCQFHVNQWIHQWCDVDYYFLREARCLIDNSFEHLLSTDVSATRPWKWWRKIRGGWKRIANTNTLHYVYTCVFIM